MDYLELILAAEKMALLALSLDQTLCDPTFRHIDSTGYTGS